MNVLLENNGHETIDATAGLIRLSYRWSKTVEEPLRTPLHTPLPAGQRAVCTIGVQAPKECGQYSFSPRLVLEGVRWFDGTSVDQIEVTADATNPDDDLNRYEDRITSQNGEDGILRELLLRVGSPARFVLEVGAGDGTENNSAQLIERYNFSACLIEGDPERGARLAKHYATRSNVSVVEAFVDAESISQLLSEKGVPAQPDVLSIDIDGNDYHVWRALAAKVQPRVVIVEYNAMRGPTEHWVMPYDPNHRWRGDDHFGASLRALEQLGADLGYRLVGTDSSGVNAFFVRDDLMEQARFPHLEPAEAYHALRGSAPASSVTSSDLRTTYTRGYYVNDCGGHADFGYDDPLSITDARLRVTANFAEIRSGRRALDLGCGRGEIAAYLAARGWDVDAIDYSADAISLATEHIERTHVAPERVRFYNQDFNSFTFEESAYDLIIAADVIEHVSSPELSQLYERVSGALSAHGLFVLHTFPNSWFYDYEWPRLRRLAEARGERLPDDPRTHFERLMHINEQSPRTLHKQLRSSFSHVAMWVGDPYDPFRSEIITSSHTALRASPDIFAVASHNAVDDVASSNAFLNTPLTAVDRSAIQLERAGSLQALDDDHLQLSVRIYNGSSSTLASAGRFPVMLSYHWLGESGETVVFNGTRTPLGQPLHPGETLTRRMRITKATSEASFARVTLVQESVAWFDGDGAYIDLARPDVADAAGTITFPL